MSKRSPRDTTPPDRIIDWENEAERAFLHPPTIPWYEKLTGDAKDAFYGVPAAEPEYKYGNQPVNDWPGLPEEFGLPRLTHDERQRTLRTEGFCFRKKYDERGMDYHVGTPKEVYDVHEEQVRGVPLDHTYVPPESDRPDTDNTGLPGALTAEGFRLMDNLPSTPVVEEFDDLPIAGAVFWLMKRAKEARLQRLREKRLREKEETA